MADRAEIEGPNMRLPQVDRILREPILIAREKEVRREILTVLTRSVLQDYRTNQNQDGSKNETSTNAVEAKTAEQITSAEIAREVCLRIDRIFEGRLRKVINGTGVILNTNLGRAPLPEGVVTKMTSILSGYSSLEISLESGKRGERIATIESLLQILTGCEAALVVNNNAAAVMLAVRALAFGKEVIISRGELIEIGGSFRLPDVVEAAGGILKEVGTTNRTRASDYANAISERTGLILKCHRSNFAVTGFTEEPDWQELTEIARKHSLPLAEDLGSGALIDLSELNLTHEPMVQEALGNGTDIVMFSGDKLLGGTQAGLVVGKKHYIEMMRKHPIYRALRPDKLAVALTENILCQYLRPDVKNVIPVYRMAKFNQEELKARAEKLANQLNARLSKLQCLVAPTVSAFGGGTMPSEALPGYGLAISIAGGAQQESTKADKKNKLLSAQNLALLLRRHDPSIVSIIVDDRVTVDLRTVDPSEENDLARAIEALEPNI